MKSLIVDNYDSFTYNLYQMVAETNGEEPIVVKNDQVTWDELSELRFDNIIISPGPGHPDNPKDFGICRRVILEINKPILGVCLGHQGICSVFGGKIVHAPKPMHGRLSAILHKNDLLFEGIPSGFKVVRYHSLICLNNIPECLDITAWTDDQLIMGVKHKLNPIWGVQFHPESICTEHSYKMLSNFKKITEQHYLNSPTLQQKNIEYDKKDNSYEKSHSSYVIDKKISLESNTPQYEVLVKKLDFYPSSDKVFDKLYKDIDKKVWLDSSAIIEGLSRFSFMGSIGGPYSYLVKYNVNNKKLSIIKDNKETTYNISIFDYLKEELKKMSFTTDNIPFNFNCGFVGYFGYELKSESSYVKNNSISEFPDAQFLFLDRIIVFDHVEEKCYLLCLANKMQKEEAEDWFNFVVDEIKNLHSDDNTAQLTFSDNINKTDDPKFHLSRDHDTYISDINKCLDYIRDGESYEICLTNKITSDVEVNGYDYYSCLRKINPAPYSCFLQFNELSVACSSMERFMSIDTKGNVETKPIKGTLKRGIDELEDSKLIQLLTDSERFKSENLMIVDLLRNDLGVVCEIGSVCVPKLMHVETYKTVHQLVSTIRGKLKPGLSSVDCIKASFPGGSMTGAPKIRTMEIIDALEEDARGIYSGGIGYLALNGSADINIVIRTATITPNRFSVGVGGAIIDLSDPEEEFDEILLKSKALVDSLRYYVQMKSKNVLQV